MDNKKKQLITNIERVLNSEDLMKEQREALVTFDRFNELEAHCSLGTRVNYLSTLYKLGKEVKNPYETMPKEDIQTYISNLEKGYSESTIALQKGHIKRFFLWIEWVRINKDKPDEEKLDIKDINAPFNVRWIKTEIVGNKLEFGDLPTEEEVLKIVGCVEKQRDRAFILTSWETGASPVEVLGMRIRDVRFNQYGAQVSFNRYVSKKTNESHELKTKYRERTIPIVSAVPDLQLWLSMHPQRNDADAPIWWSRQGGGALGYVVAQDIFKRACKRAEIQKHLTLYSLRHGRITQVSEVLSVPELKEFCGHSKSSRVAETRYVHVNGENIKRKLLAERGVEIQQEQKQETSLQVKVCPRCHENNSPVHKFCFKCSAPLDTETMFEVQRQGEILNLGSERATTNPEYDHLMKMFARLSPEVVKKIQQEMWSRVAVELIKQTT
jgi:integrase